MKRSRKVELTLVAGLALSGCGRRMYDPCSPQTFNEIACQDAISHNGYYYGGQWYSHSYSGGYSYYYNDYNRYVRSGGSVTRISPSEWSRPATSSGSTSGSATGGTSSGDISSVSHGVFGSSAHGSSSGGGE
jgi:hypothetical protein